ncbi:MAG: UDP-N-acetylmuramoyl-L-alanyl-D-glutamate--2,6-diaminopimelate ligase [Micrococcales bacterium]|nr:UDP-N-acetylmuramoyl-L-alanyl-D-glutamate--2,6-diaminopimelate ligase [Micrococcales bacterium]
MSLRPQRGFGHSLDAVAKALGSARVVGQATVSGLTLASDEVEPGDLFVALPGARTHGGLFAFEAVGLGAAAVLVDDAGAHLVDAGVPLVVAEDLRPRLGDLAAWFYDHPGRSLKTIGVTGTNGKTTVTHMLAAALGGLGAVLGTVGARIGHQELPQERTTMEAPALQAALATMVERGIETCVMEVSSHAISAHRVDGLVFDLVAFTNLSRDHLDFHGSMESYFAAKAALFEPKHAKAAIIDVDSEWGQRLAQLATIPVQTLARRALGDTAGGGPAWRFGTAKVLADGSRLYLQADGIELEAGVPMPGEFDVANAAMALALAIQTGAEPAAAAAGLAAMDPVPGRMEVVPRPVDGPSVVIDYAHAPEAIAQCLAALRPHVTGRLIAVLGAGGGRDLGKRELMGVAAAEAADLVVISDDNPRSEEPAVIRAQVLAGARAAAGAEAKDRVIEIPGRAEAICYAIEQAQAGDLVALLGKGHEQTIEVAGEFLPHSDKAVALQALALNRGEA